MVTVTDMDGDLDRDGVSDIVAVASESGELVWYRGPALERTVLDNGLPGAHDVAAADLNGDGLTDLVVTSTTTNSVVIFLGSGT